MMDNWFVVTVAFVQLLLPPFKFTRNCPFAGIRSKSFKVTDDSWTVHMPETETSTPLIETASFGIPCGAPSEGAEADVVEAGGAPNKLLPPLVDGWKRLNEVAGAGAGAGAGAWNMTRTLTWYKPSSSTWTAESTTRKSSGQCSPTSHSTTQIDLVCKKVTTEAQSPVRPSCDFSIYRSLLSTPQYLPGHHALWTRALPSDRQESEPPRHRLDG